MKEIEGYGGQYLACPKTGQIWTTGSNKLPKGGYLKPWLIGNGYEMIMLYNNTTPRKFLVHRLIAITFVPNPQGLTEVNHKDGNHRNNRPKNLEWVTSSQNKAHAWKAGLYTHGKVSKKQADEIRSLYLKGGIFQREIAERYGVTQAYVSWIVRGNNRKHNIIPH